MNAREITRELIIGHSEKYPMCEVRDILKFVYQSAFGCEHLVSCGKAATDRIRKEYESMPEGSNLYIEELDGNYSRVGLGYLGLGLDAEVLGDLFFRSAKKEKNAGALLEEKLAVIRELINEQRLPFSLSEFDNLVGAWREEGYPPISHSAAFRNSYYPAYRVVANEYLPIITAATEKSATCGS